MQRAEWEDLSAFYQPESEGGFAKPAFFIAPDGTRAEKPVYVIYDDPAYDAMLGEYVFEGSKPRINGPAELLKGLDIGDKVEVSGEIFDVNGPSQTDGTGTATVFLSRPGNVTLRY